jgi:hypothetical protein
MHQENPDHISRIPVTSWNISVIYWIRSNSSWSFAIFSTTAFRLVRTDVAEALFCRSSSMGLQRRQILRVKDLWELAWCSLFHILAYILLSWISPSHCTKRQLVHEIHRIKHFCHELSRVRVAGWSLILLAVTIGLAWSVSFRMSQHLFPFGFNGSWVISLFGLVLGVSGEVHHVPSLWALLTWRQEECFY